MSTATSLKSLFLAVTILFASAASSAQPLMATRDDPAWRDVVNSYFLTYAKKDIEGVLSLWSGQSPQLAAERQALGETFAAYEKIELKEVTLRSVKVEGEKVAVRAAVEMNVTKKGEPVPRLRKLNCVFQFVREAAAWKVSSEASAEKELAALLAAANTDEERQRLLTDERELLTVELREALIVEARSLRVKGDHARALTVLEVASGVAEKIGDREGTAIVLGSIGDLHSMRGNHAEALNYYEQSVALSEALGDKAGLALNLNNIGLIHKSQGNYAQALDCYQKSRALSEELGNKTGVARSLNNIGIVHEARGDYAQALAAYQKSLEVSAALGNKVFVATNLNNIGNVNGAKGDYAQALDHYQKSLKLRQELGDKFGVASTLNNIGVIYRLQSNYTRALEAYQKSLDISDALGNKTSVAGTLGNIGVVYKSQGNYAQALKYYEQSLALSETLGEKAMAARALNNIGEIHQAQSQYAQALDYYRRSLALKEALGDKAGRSASLNNLGEAHAAEGSYAQALERYQQSLSLKEALGDKAGTANVLINIGSLYQKQGRALETLDFVARAEALARQIGSLDLLWPSQLLAARAYTSLDRPTDARRNLLVAIDTIETIRNQVAGREQDSQRFFENKVSPYLAMAELLVHENNASEALTYAERAKSRVLLDVLRSGRINVTKAMRAEELEQEQQLTGRLVSLNSQIHRESLHSEPDQNRLANLKTQLQTARLDCEAFQTSLYAAHPELKVKRGEASPLRLDEAVDLLPNARSALLEYLVTEKKTYLFVLTRSADARKAKAEVQVFTLNVSAKELSERASHFRQQLATHDLLYRQTAIELYELLLGPARELIKGKRLLTIVPDAALWELPFQALQPTPGRHLIEDSAIAYAPSLTVLRDMNQARAETRGAVLTPPMSLLAVGNPVLGTQSVARLQAMNSELTPLPQAEEQVKALQRLYGARHSKVYIGSDAREERVKSDAGKYRILHLATHGIYDDASPMYSHVVLGNEAANADEDGFLEAWEIMNLDLHAELVVLSACETARGRVGAGEGMIGLAWSLFVAGSPSTVVSQWKVDAASTTTLMLEFHRRMRAGNSKADALQQATLKILQDKKYRHPFYWAPFVLIGDAN
jgi:CHAT domain-containing protein/tetratricopeptide (TPR) repeat protein